MSSGYGGFRGKGGSHGGRFGGFRGGHNSGRGGEGFNRKFGSGSNSGFDRSFNSRYRAFGSQDGGERGRGFNRGRGGFRGRGDGFRGRGDGFRGRGDGFRGRGAGRGGRGRNAVFIEPHKHENVYIAKGRNDCLVTKNFLPGVSVYGEKRITIKEGDESVEYRVWNPFRSKLAAGILSGMEEIYMKPGSKVLYLGAASGTTVSHVSDIVGENGLVFAVEFSLRCGRDLLTVAQKRNNIVPIIEDARHPLKYRMVVVDLVDVIFADVAQPDQARIVAINAHHYLKAKGHVLISIKANCIDSTAAPEAVFAEEVKKLRGDMFKPLEQVTLEPYERDHAMVVALYRPEGTKISYSL